MDPGAASTAPWLDLALPRQLRKLDSYDFLLLDDLGYLPQGAEESEVLFTLIAERYERRSLGITSNPQSWLRAGSGLLPVGAHLRQSHGHRGGHRPGGASLGHPGIQCPQLPDRNGPAAGSG